MRRIMILAALLAGCGGPKHETSRPVTDEPNLAAGQPEKAEKGAAESSAVAAEEAVPAGEDILAKVLEMNSDKYGSPPTKFRKGHVTRRKPPKAKRTARGFEIQFPSGAPIVTPAVYQNKLYVSGGFNSKEYYAFEAKTGNSTWAVNLDDDGPSSTACAQGVCVFNTESCVLWYR